MSTEESGAGSAAAEGAAEPGSPRGDRRSRPFELRELVSAGDYDQCLELQQATWGHDFRELVPITILRISQKVGGILAGAVAPDGTVLGFVYGLTGVRGGELVHWSHMLAVRSSARGLGLGTALKVYQRQRLLELGCRVMQWTFDPLVARNANLNLGRLGAVPREYVIDMYGNETGSELHSGLGTDRFVVEWRFADDEVARRLESGERWRAAAPGEDDWVVDAEAAEPVSWSELERARPRALWVRVPADIDRLKREQRDVALRWRDALRRTLGWAFDEGYRVAGLAGDLRSDGRVWYALERGGSSEG